MTAGEVATATQSGVIRFLLGGDVVEVRGVSPTKSVLMYLREDLRRVGTKEGCAEGDCGACTVVLAQSEGEGVRLRAVNSCIQFVATLDGKALFTVEDLRDADRALHPVQQAMVDCHGSQCGFCTPGFVMSLWALFVEHAERGTRPGDAQLRTALSGNLCRCTGYRPILEAGVRMFELGERRLDRAALRDRLDTLARGESLAYAAHGQRFWAPRTLDELLGLRAAHPRAVVLAGGTDVGLWASKQLRELPEVIYLGEVAELLRIETREASLSIGSAVSLADGFAALCRHYPELDEIHERFASVPVRNAGTLGGNVANGSPIGDSMPALIALGARVVLAAREGRRTMPLEELYIDYMKKAMRADEIVASLEVPLPSPRGRFRSYKLAKRYDSDISAVCAAFAIEIEDGRIVAARVAFGGMAATPRRATHTERALRDRAWCEQTAREAMSAIALDYTPIGDMRASAAYRAKAARNLLYRFFLETRPEAPLDAAALSVFTAR